MRLDYDHNSGLWRWIWSRAFILDHNFGIEAHQFSALVSFLGDITFIDRFQLNLKIFLSLAPTCILNIAILLKFRGSHECITSWTIFEGRMLLRKNRQFSNYLKLQNGPNVSFPYANLFDIICRRNTRIPISPHTDCFYFLKPSNF